MRQQVIFILGGPGSGKGTQCQVLTQKFQQLVHLSAGDLLREERNNQDSELGQKIQHCMINGKIVPSEITVNLLKNKMDQNPGRSFLIDGFPRNLENYQVWNEIIKNSVEVIAVLLFECQEEEMIKRMLQRGRQDDQLEVMIKRFQSNQRDTMPIIELLDNQNLVQKFNAQQDIELLNKQVIQFLQIKKFI